jgi:hypothetical protein
MWFHNVRHNFLTAAWRLEIMDMTVVYWALLAGVSVVALGFGIVEYQAYMLRTDVKSVPGGLKFTSQFFTVEASRSEKLVKITCKNGQHKTTPVAGEPDQIRTGALSLSMTAAGMRIQVSQIGKRKSAGDPLIATGVSLIEFSTPDKLEVFNKGKAVGPRTTLEIEGIPDSVGQAFRHFAEGLDVWFDKLERDIATEIAVREQQEAITAAVAAQKKAQELKAADKTPKVALGAAERDAKGKAQLAQWRNNAGFAGTRTEMRVDAFGGIEWLIDLNPDGRIILHADNLHFHGTLEGSVITMLADDLEVKVRDEFWQEGDRNLPTFRVLKGFTREALLDWRDRLIHAGEIFVHDPGRHAPQPK